jgi:predicted nucleic acid-binding protein
MTICVAIEMNGMTDQPGKRIYFDSNAFIYAIEGDDEISSMLHELLGALRLQPGLACTSELTLAEILPKANAIQRRNYFTLVLHSGLFDLLPVTRDILIETTDYRRSRSRPSYDAQSAMPKLADAIHVVSAVRAKCDTFVSFDRGLQLPLGLNRVGHEEGHLRRLVRDLS